MNSDFVLYIDFDSTLYNTKLLTQDLWAVIARHTHLPLERISADRANHSPHPALRSYDYVSHITSYGLDPETMWKELDNLAQRNYLYDDSVKFIQSLRAEGYDPKILSFGEKRFQLAKINAMIPILQGTNTSTPLEAIVVDRRKGEHIAELHEGQTGALVDDVPGQQLPEGFTEIHLDRERDLPEPLVQPGGFIVSNLTQAKNIIEQLHPAK